MIVIVDYGMGNLGSILNMFKRIGVSASVTNDEQELQDAEKLLLPGVGSFDSAMERLNGSGLREALDKKVLQDRTPVLGICLGMQLLTRGSEEGSLPGLGWIDAATKKFPVQSDLKVPHMGWNEVRPVSDSPLMAGLQRDTRFYFVHSYYVTVDNTNDSIYKSRHGVEFDAAINHKNIFGVQFHPEKSHKFGMQLLKNFGEL